ncbi:MAG: hypothetical protein RJB66_1803 [Pseudomonadota bacterium]|jgi:uncharacterized membrane protein YoaK (UPF0700 family)
MYRLETKEYLKNRFIGLWSLLAFQAGFLNSLGFLACQRFVSHVTGFGTHVGISLGEGNYWMAFELFTAPLSFILGAWLSAYFTVARQSRGLVPRYDLVTLFIPLILFVMMSLGVKGMFGVFAGAHSFQQDALLLTALTFICGLQNGCFATLTKGQIRTTHLTGISTDLGTDLALTLNGELAGEERRQAIRRNLMRLATFSSFSVGALISAIVDSQLLYWSFAIPLVTSLIVAGVFQAVKHQVDEGHLDKKSQMA